METDQTYDANLRSWVASANGHADFPIQNLPLGIFSLATGTARGGVAIGDEVLDLGAAIAADLFSGDALRAATAAAGDTLNAFLELGAASRWALRRRLSELLASPSRHQPAMRTMLHAQRDVTMHLPARIGDFTDFYVGIHHATHVGQLFRPENPLLPNYKHVPISYHGRSSSVVASGTPIRRPRGQLKRANSDRPVFAPTERLDFELELGLWIGPGNAHGEPIAINNAAEHIAGFCLLNDWSARDVQAWEYQPLGPFLAKNFASTISPWLITSEALIPFRMGQPARPEGDPLPLDYLLDAADQRHGGLAIELEVLLLTAEMKARSLPPQRIGLSSTRHMYWTAAQMVTHHTCNGCNLRPGDLLGTGTISGPDMASSGSLLEATHNGTVPLQLESGEERKFLENGDEVVLRARGVRDGYVKIGFGECRTVILPARP